MQPRLYLTGLLSLALLPAALTQVHAQTADYPSKPIRILVGSPPGGPSDIVTRVFAEQLTQRSKQPVVVENRPGVGKSLAAGVVARAEPDGYTLALSPDTVVTVNPLVYTKLNFDARTELVNVSVLAIFTQMLVCNSSRGIKNAADLAELERASMEIMKKPEVRSKLQASDLVPVGSTSSEAQALMQAESARWEPLVRRMGLKAE